MKTMEEYLDEIADMVMGSDPRVYLSADWDDNTGTLYVWGPNDEALGHVSISVLGDTPQFDMEHACFNAGYLVGLAQSNLGNTETLQ